MKLFTQILVLIFAAFSLTACGGSDGDGSPRQESLLQPETTPESEPASVATTQFIAMGDSGSGSPGQFAVGESMAAVCRLKAVESGPCEFVLGFGDNIYENGATSVDDAQFEEKFEKPFEPMGNIPFYMVLGNHDNTGYIAGDGANNSRGDMQVEYHYEGNSPRWRMPARYYAFDSQDIPTSSMPLTRDGKPLINVVSLDSNPLASTVADADSRFSWQNYGMNQLIWAQDEMVSSQALFDIAVAHHPYLSNGSHGNAGNYDFIPSFILPIISGQRWKDFIEEAVCDYADVMMTGHDHDLQVLESVESCGRTRFVVSGAAGKKRSLQDTERNRALFQQGDTYGFFWVWASESNLEAGEPAKMCFEAYTVDPQVEGFGVIDGEGLLTPAYSQCLAKEEPENIGRGKDFSGTPISMPVRLSEGNRFDMNFAGPLKVFREQLTSGLNTFNMANPNAETQQVVAQMINGIDTLLAAIDASASSISEGGSTGDIMQANFAVQAAADRLSSINTSQLPAPFDRLGDAFIGFSDGFGAVGDANSGQGLSQDTAFLLGPVVQLAINIDNIVDAVDQQAEPVPVLRGVTSLLSTVLRAVGITLEQVAALDSSGGTDALVGSINSALNTLVLEVLLLEEAPDSINQNPTLPANFLSDALLTVLREVTEQLDNNVLSVVDDLLGRLLSPLTGLIAGILDDLL